MVTSRKLASKASERTEPLGTEVRLSALSKLSIVYILNLKGVVEGLALALCPVVSFLLVIKWAFAKLANDLLFLLKAHRMP